MIARFAAFEILPAVIKEFFWKLKFAEYTAANVIA
jgi:hypothetical protein